MPLRFPAANQWCANAATLLRCAFPPTGLQYAAQNLSDPGMQFAPTAAQ